MFCQRIIISGRVQGVGYRAWTVRTASEMGLKGWVRNLRDGNVEAVFCGEEAKVHAVVEKCREGPMLARVSDIKSFAYDEPLSEEPFTSKPTV